MLHGFVAHLIFFNSETWLTFNTSNLRKAHKTRDSLAVLVRRCFSLFPSVSLQFTLEICAAATNWQKR